MQFLFYISVVVIVFIVLVYKFPFVRICERSMLPRLKDGELYIGYRYTFTPKVTVGKIYIFKPPYFKTERRYVIKRAALCNNRKVYFLGDNPEESYDSRDYGLIEAKNIVGKLLVKVGEKHEKDN